MHSSIYTHSYTSCIDTAVCAYAHSIQLCVCQCACAPLIQLCVCVCVRSSKALLQHVLDSAEQCLKFIYLSHKMYTL